MQNPWKLLKRTLRAFGVHHGLEMAAAIAYHVLFSFIPLITVFLAVMGFILRDPLQQQIATERLLTALPQQSSGLIHDSVGSISDHSGTLTVLGVLGLVWAASGLFGVVRVALNTAWGVKTRRGFLVDKLFDIGAVMGLGILLVASMAGTMMIHVIETSSAMPAGSIGNEPLQILITALGLAVPAAISFVAFLLLYVYIPSVRHAVSDVWPGALLATLLFEGGKHGFAFYVSRFNHYQTLYGALGAVMLFMLWTHLSASIMLIGAELAAQYERPRHIESDRGVE